MTINKLIFALAVFMCAGCQLTCTRRIVVEQKPIGDPDMDQIMGQFAIQIRKDIVKLLLVGNNTQCFTTEQYMDKYITVVHKGQKLGVDLHLCRRHLKSTKMVRQVKPDLWTTKLDPSDPLRKSEADALKKIADFKGE